MLGGADNPNGELLSYIIGADKRTVPAGSKGTNWYRQDYTQHKVVVPGASRCLAKVAHQTGGYPQKVDCQPQP
ncbi:hypothetical protein ACCO19_004639 [Escherichia coli]